MAVVVGVHGIAQQYRGGYQLAAAWLVALRDGLVAAGHADAAERLGVDDLRVAFFGDLFRPAGAMSAQGPQFTVADVKPGLERELLTALYDEVVTVEPELAPPEDSMGPGRVGLQVVVAKLLQSRTFAGVAQRTLIGNVKQAVRFLVEPDVKVKVLERVSAMVGPDTRVLVGHSLGSVVAYEFLCSAPSSVRTLITLGSPLGVPNLIFDRLTPAPDGGKGVWPQGISNWVNIAERNDVVPLRKTLAELFPPTSGGAGVLDRLVDNGDEPHAVERYLNAAATGAAVGQSLG
ncbi:PGAP1-like alpha/beta domain-containing protein [Nocardia pseudobrasiliensis]|uniref:PGAP1-like alpha/beta domain-containing protein n=1 Tax=Nocardia pseudobrasiliensis TaxID=45979 RepID=UPI00082B6434|nr:alpha/beta hydrolase [Nocardia pseudobrasiliensis]